MGNQQSQSKDKESQLWSKWPSTEKDQLKKRFDSLNTPQDLPEYFSQDLYSCIVSNLKANDIIHYLEIAHGVLKSKDPNTIYLLFQYAVEKNQVSMETFVSWVVTSSVPLWFESGSSYVWSTLDSDNSKPLIKYMLNHAHDKEKQKNDAMAWLYDNDDEQQQQQTKNTTTDEESWETKLITSPSKITESEFLHWIENMPAFIGLIQLVMEFILSGKQPANHKRRIEHLSSPQIQQHGKDTRKLFGKNKFSSLMNAFDYYMLTLYLPVNALSWSDYEKNQRKVDHDVQHDLLFSSRRDGTSWQVFVNKMVGQGATLVVIKSKDGSLFGGYADDAWEYARTDWYGNSTNFLFRLSKQYGAWDASQSSNGNFQYLCWGKKSLPNGFGMGGQFDYAGLWIDSDFIHGHSRAGPLCTTYCSPQLSTNDSFLIDEVEVWLARPLQKDNEDETGVGGGVLSHAEDMEFMEMAGKKMYSKDLGPDLVEDNDSSDDADNSNNIKN